MHRSARGFRASPTLPPRCVPRAAARRIAVCPESSGGSERAQLQVPAARTWLSAQSGLQRAGAKAKRARAGDVISDHGPLVRYVACLSVEPEVGGRGLA